MGQMRFRLHDQSRIPAGGLERIYVAGAEEIPWSTRARWQGEELVVERSNNESGSVYVPWRVDGQGQCFLATGTLMERQHPYLLEVELARGLIQRIRNRLFIWEFLGMITPVELNQQLQLATRNFSRAATMQSNHVDAAEHANTAIAQALEMSEAMVGVYAQQAMASRQQQTPVSTLMGVALGPKLPSVETRRKLVDACNIIQIPIGWRAIEQREGKRNWKHTDEQLAWCQQAGLKVSAGPLLQMDDRGIPDWLVLWDGDFDNLMKLFLDHVKSVVSRYAGRVHLWQVASRVNTGKMLSLEEEQRLHLVAHALDLVRKLDPRTPTVVSFDQPWAEYLGAQTEDLAPSHYADALVRADLGISGFALEINAGFRPGGSVHRPTFEWGRLLDQWSMWGLPLMACISTASAESRDPSARKNIDVSFPSGMNQSDQDPQRYWAGAILPMLLARSAVQVVLWNQLTDSEPHEFPHAGLFDGKGQPKPTLDLMRDLRKSLL
ncbi:MAG: endo-1,4-beta-xylanase [Bythopirellula sp.]|nr:endo-1,4-beta-xylanase [Bythopirellula sp.]